MDIVFDCPNCSQELAVDSSGAGSEIQCPSCSETITIPMASTRSPSSAAAAETPASTTAPASTVAASAAAKVEKHLRVPVRTTPSEVLIAKPASALAKTSGVKGIRTHTVRHASCVESGHDHFDEVVTKFLSETGEANIIGIHTISYTLFDVTTQKMMTDYGVLVVYRG
jgi:DNA-directed RNA polymerase subunit RPC12/RpoP